MIESFSTFLQLHKHRLSRKYHQAKKLLYGLSKKRRDLTPKFDPIYGPTYPRGIRNTKIFNQYGQGGAPAHMSPDNEYVRKLDKILQKIKTKKDMTVYRGISHKRVPTEKETELPVFQSTSLSKKTAKMFANYYKDKKSKHVMVMKVPKGTSAAHIEKYKSPEDYYYQDEVVLRPGKFHLKKKTYKPLNKTTYYHGDYEEKQ